MTVATVVYGAAVLKRLYTKVFWRLANSRHLYELIGTMQSINPSFFPHRDRAHIASTARVGGVHFNTYSGTITVGEHAFITPGVQLLTGTHDVTTFGEERSNAIPPDGRDIVIADGVWIASGAMVVGPCRIGKDAVVAAGSVVTRDVPDGAIVAGVPAEVIGSAYR